MKQPTRFRFAGPLTMQDLTDQYIDPMLIPAQAYGFKKQPAPFDPDNRDKGQPKSLTDQYLSDPTVQQPQGEAAQDDQYKEPDASTWLGRRWQDVRGRVDERYKGLPSLNELGVAPISDENQFKLTAQGDEAYADFYQKQLGENFTRRIKDVHGFTIIGFKGQDGQEQLAYVNKPGWEFNDIDRGLTGSLPYMVAGGVAGRAAGQAPWAINALAQGMAAGGTSVATDVAAGQLGSEQGVDPVKAGVAAGAGVVAASLSPMLQSAWRKMVTEPRYYNARLGKLTPEGEDIIQRLGLNADDLTQEMKKRFAQEYARTGNARVAQVDAELGDLEIPTTLGQRTKDVSQLAREQELRDGVWGQAQADYFRNAAGTGFDQKQIRAIENVTTGDIAPGKPGFARYINPHRPLDAQTPGQIGGDIGDRLAAAQSAARSQEREAWKSVTKLKATPAAKQQLQPNYIQQAVDDTGIVIDTVAGGNNKTPVAVSMTNFIDDFVKGKAPTPPKGLKSTAVNEVTHFRKRLSAMMQDAETRQDVAVTKAIYGAVNKWIDDMADNAMLEGDPLSAGAMRVARGVTRQLHEVFSGEPGSAGARIMQNVLKKTDSPEGIIRHLFVSPQARSTKEGANTALNAIKQATKYLPEEEGAQLWNDVRLAFWMRLVRNEQGKIYNPQVMMKNIRRSMESQRSTWNLLYNSQERAYANRIVRALENGPTWEDWTIKPNSSRSATVGARLMMDIVSLFFGRSYAKSVTEAAARATGLGRMQAYRALGPTPGKVPLRLTGPASAGAVSYRNQSRGEE